jgi:broad specificity phosphatase PhoE
MRRFARRLVAAALPVAIGFVLGRFAERQRAPAWADGGVVPPGGDLNGDSRVDVSDAVHLLLFLFQGGAPPAPCEQEPVTTLIVTRHAERESTGADPTLTERGWLRAAQLAKLVGTARIDELIASERRRTVDTLTPLAEALGRTADDILRIEDVEDVVAHVRALPQGSTAVLCHHSFTIHPILDGLCVSGHDEIDFAGDSHENWLLIEFRAAGTPQLHHFQYADIPEPCPAGG